MRNGKRPFEKDENDLFCALSTGFDELDGERLLFFSAHHLYDGAGVTGIPSGEAMVDERRLVRFEEEARDAWVKAGGKKMKWLKRLRSAARDVLHLRGPEAKAQEALSADVRAYLVRSSFSLSGTHLENVLKCATGEPMSTDGNMSAIGPAYYIHSYPSEPRLINTRNVALFLAEYLYTLFKISKPDLSNNLRVLEENRGASMLFLPISALGQFRAAACWIDISSEPRWRATEKFGIRAIRLHESQQWSGRLYTTLLTDIFLSRLARSLTSPSAEEDDAKVDCHHPTDLCETLALLWRADEILITSYCGQIYTVGKRKLIAGETQMHFCSDKSTRSSSELYNMLRNDDTCFQPFPKVEAEGTDTLCLEFSELAGEKIARLCDVSKVIYRCSYLKYDLREQKLAWALLKEKTGLLLKQEIEAVEASREGVAAGLAHEFKNFSAKTADTAILARHHIGKRIDKDNPENEELGKLVDKLVTECTFLSASSLALYKALQWQSEQYVKITDFETSSKIAKAILSLIIDLIKNDEKIIFGGDILPAPKEAIKELDSLLDLRLANATPQLLFSSPVACLNIIPLLEPIRNIRIQKPAKGDSQQIHVMIRVINADSGVRLDITQVQVEGRKPHKESFKSRSLVRLYRILRNTLNIDFDTEFFCEEASHFSWRVDIRTRLKIPGFLKGRARQ